MAWDTRPSSTVWLIIAAGGDRAPSIPRLLIVATMLLAACFLDGVVSYAIVW